MVKFTFLILALFFMISCGDDGKKNTCMTLEQVMILCIAEGIELRPEPWQLWTIELDCQRQYITQQCYKKQESYFPYEY